MDVLKKELKDEITHLLYDQTRRTPIVIPVINEIGGNRGGGNNDRGERGGDRRQNNRKDDGGKKDGEFKRPAPKKFPAKQVPDTEVAMPKNREEPRAY